MNLTICKEIRHTEIGYIVMVRCSDGAYSVEICNTIEGVFELLKIADYEPIRRKAAAEST